MATMKERHKFEASEQTYKKVLRRWGFSKNIPSSTMMSIITTVENRRTQSGKRTNVYWCGQIIDNRKLERFKKRKIASSGDLALSASLGK